MALYYLETAEGVCIVRARNGNHALDLFGAPATVNRITEEGEFGVLSFGETPERPPDEERPRYLDGSPMGDAQ